MASKGSVLKTIGIAAVALGLLAGLSACGSADHPEKGAAGTEAVQGPSESTPSPASQSDAGVNDKASTADREAQAEFPRQLTVGNETVTIDKRPVRIAALSLDTAEMVLELTDASHVAVAPRGIDDPTLARNTEAGQNIPNKIAGATMLDPEQVLSYDPDLVLLTTIHDGERDADPILKQAGIPLITFQEWNTLQKLQQHLQLIGQAIGQEDKAESIVADMNRRISAVENAVENSKVKPSVLVLSPVGPNTGPYLLGQTNISYDLVVKAGGVPAVDLIGVNRTTKASIEQVMKADPDMILVIEWDDKGDSELEEMMSQAAWQSLQAVHEGRVKKMKANQVTNPNLSVIDSLEEIAEWVREFASGQEAP
ncbi:ABC transporter substrate-binding protein [Paenibacillus sp. J2TS4]|uniref:ABC transporter substrate-binding protein n=1 Tax=Paenibacillus sp. J2TS4 TaxID=2807194 RepID=UPI001B27E62F|nr:ABC transporter substrate-binding protein [Paenibacillus sp. J2TS4]GIP31533.1 ABC transporter substrate-binding protein [Paenibacillus sp. J2TS4]